MCGAWRLWHNMVTNNEEGVQLVRFHYPKRPEGICPDGKFRRQGARTPLLSRLAGPTTHYKNETLAIAPFRMLVTILCHSLHAPHTSTCPPYTRRPSHTAYHIHDAEPPQKRRSRCVASAPIIKHFIIRFQSQLYTCQV